MNETLAICNLYQSPSLGKITERRPLATVSFLGRYALMDFALSNFANSGFNSIVVPIEHGIDSIRSHVRSGEIWVSNTKTGFFDLHLFENGLKNPDLNTDINNISTLFGLENRSFKYVVIAPVKFLYNFDYRFAIERHKKTRADITVLTTKINKNIEDFKGCDAVSVSKNGVITSIKTLSDKKKSADISLESYVFSREVFLDLLKKGQQRSYKSTINSMVSYFVSHKSYRVISCPAEVYVAPMISFDNYVKYSLAVLDIDFRKKFFDNDWPIYTTTHNTPPTLYGEKADVKNSSIANGSMINGKVVNSIISRNVVVEEGAVVKNCILFTSTVVGKAVSLENVVADKGAQILKRKNIKGKKNEPICIGQDEMI